MVTPRDGRLVPVAFAPDQETAERWADALEAAGIEAHIRIEDGAHLGPAGSAYGSALGRPFVYPVLVSRLSHRAARRALASEAGAAPAGPGLTARAVATAAAVLCGSMVLVACVAWARGDL